MPVTSHKLGPGLLTFGKAGSVKEFGAALTKCELIPTADDGDTIHVLSGDEISDPGQETWTLGGSLLQAYDTDSLILWCNTNTGTDVPFVFRPDSGNALKATGSVLVRSVKIGGDVKKRNQSDFTFKATNVTLTTTTAEEA